MTSRSQTGRQRGLATRCPEEPYTTSVRTVLWEPGRATVPATRHSWRAGACARRLPPRTGGSQVRRSAGRDTCCERVEGLARGAASAMQIRESEPLAPGGPSALQPARWGTAGRLRREARPNVKAGRGSDDRNRGIGIAGTTTPPRWKRSCRGTAETRRCARWFREAAVRCSTEAVARLVTWPSRRPACGSSGRSSRPPRAARRTVLVRSGSRPDIRPHFRFERPGVCRLDRPRLTPADAHAGKAAVGRRRPRRLARFVRSGSQDWLESRARVPRRAVARALAGRRGRR